MKKNKKIIFFVILFACIFTLTACGKKTDYMILVNKQNKLPEDWEERIELVDVKTGLGETYQVEKKTAEAYQKLKEELKDEIVIELDSTYRTVARQQEIWDQFEKEKGLEYAQYSAACAEAMARAVQNTCGTDYAIGVTGTLGRVDPANRDSTPGEVFFCILRTGERNRPAAAEQTAVTATGQETADASTAQAAVSTSAAQATAEATAQAAGEAFTERMELDPRLPRPEAKLAVAEAVLARLLSLL